MLKNIMWACGLLLFVVFDAAAASAPVSFAAPKDYAVPSAKAVVLADFDGDGKPDIAATNVYSQSVTLFLNAGGLRTAAVGQYPVALAVGDFNGDGKPDLVSANANTISVLLSNGDGTFQAAKYSPAGQGPTSIAVADFNGDQKMDVAVINEVTTLSVFLGKGDGTFQPRMARLLPEGGSRIATGDFNGDSKMDIAVTVISATHSVGVLRGTGDGTFLSPLYTQIPITFNQPLDLAAGDFNGDGKLDLAVTTASSLYLLAGSGNGLFQTTSSRPLPFNDNGITGIAVGDFNKDSKLDVVSADGWVYIGNGDGTFQIVSHIGTPVPANSVAVGDLDGDSSLDLVFSQAHLTGDTSSGTVSIRFGRGDGNFFGTPGLRTGFSTVAQAVADFNGDGKMDIAFGAEETTRRIAVVLGNGDGTFRPMPFIAAFPNYILALVAGDFNGDSKMDLAVAQSDDVNPGLSKILLLVGNGDGSFQNGPTISALENIEFMTVADFNRDGKRDLAITTFVGAYHLSLLIGNGDGTFQPPASVNGGASPTRFAVADFNGDSKPDLAVLNENGNINLHNISVLLGNGDGTFQPPQEGVIADQQRAIAVGDFNADSKMDVAVVDANGTEVLLGNGNGTFQSAVRYLTGNLPTDLAAADFNGDHKLDLAIMNRSTVSILLGNGDGTFSPQFTGYSASGEGVLTVADLTSDGKPDLVIGEDGRFGSLGIAILVNTTP